MNVYVVYERFESFYGPATDIINIFASENAADVYVRQRIANRECPTDQYYYVEHKVQE